MNAGEYAAQRAEQARARKAHATASLAKRPAPKAPTSTPYVSPIVGRVIPKPATATRTSTPARRPAPHPSSSPVGHVTASLAHKAGTPGDLRRQNPTPYTGKPAVFAPGGTRTAPVETPRTSVKAPAASISAPTAPHAPAAVLGAPAGAPAGPLVDPFAPPAGLSPYGQPISDAGTPTGFGPAGGFGVYSSPADSGGGESKGLGITDLAIIGGTLIALFVAIRTKGKRS